MDGWILFSAAAQNRVLSSKFMFFCLSYIGKAGFWNAGMGGWMDGGMVFFWILMYVYGKVCVCG